MARRLVHPQKVEAKVTVLISEQEAIAAESPLLPFPDSAEVEAGLEAPDDKKCLVMNAPP